MPAQDKRGGRSLNGWARMGWGLVGARLCVPASDSSPQERHRHKRKLTVMVTKAEMTLGSHKTSQLEFPSKQTRELTRCDFHYSRCQNSRAVLNLTVKGRIRSAGDLGLARGLLGSCMKLWSDPIIQLAEVAARLEGDDGWNTCGGRPRCGAHGAGGPDQPAPFLLILGKIPPSRNRRDSVMKPLRL